MVRGRQICRWEWKTRANRGLKRMIIKKAKNCRVTRSTSSAILEKYSKSGVARRLSLHCELEFPVTKRKLRSNSPGYRPYYVHADKDYWREMETFVDPTMTPLDLGKPSIPLEGQLPKYVEVNVNGNVNYYLRDGEEQRLAKAAKDKLMRKRRALYGGVRKRRCTKNVIKDEAVAKMKVLEYVHPCPVLQNQLSSHIFRNMVARCAIA